MEQQLKNEVGLCFKKIAQSNASWYSSWPHTHNSNHGKLADYYDIKDRLPIYKHLKDSYEQLKEYVDKTRMDFETEESKRRAEFYKSHTSENAEKRNDFRESLIAHQSEGKQTSEDSITNGNELPREQFKKQDGPSID